MSVSGIQAISWNTEEVSRGVRKTETTNRTVHRVPKQNGKIDLTLFIFSSKIRVCFCDRHKFK
jgi:hypothetical protein